MAEAIRKAAEDKDVKAILFRVDSPGGSYVASDTVWHEVEKASKGGKPVIVSMGDVAGSGGYFVAMAADKIVAEPSTITGSIGVFSGKFVTSDMWAKLGVTFDEIQTSQDTLMYGSTHKFTDEQWEKLNATLDRIYDDFTTKAAEGRGLPLDKVKEIAKGRIWSGEDGKRLGLVDELGGFTTAIRLAKEAAGLAADAKVQLRQFPSPKSPFEILFGQGRDNSRDEAARAAVAEVLDRGAPAHPPGGARRPPRPAAGRAVDAGGRGAAANEGGMAAGGATRAPARRRRWRRSPRRWRGRRWRRATGR